MWALGQGIGDDCASGGVAIAAEGGPMQWRPEVQFSRKCLEFVGSFNFKSSS